MPVSISRCGDYNQQKVDEAVASALSNLGGIRKFIKPGDRVALKVNLLTGAEPERAVTTHPAVVRAVAGQVLDAGGSPFILDSPGAALFYNEKNLREVYQITGMAGVAKEAGVDLNFNTEYSSVPNPRGRLIKRFDIINPALDADRIINLPKIKTHEFTFLTCAVKNFFGLIPGIEKPGYHSKLHDRDRFCQMLLDIHQAVPEDLVLVDGVIGMEGDGPHAGRQREVGIILAGTDPVEIDAVAAAIIGMEPQAVPYLRLAAEQGEAVDPRRISIVGDRLQPLEPKFALPSTLTTGDGFNRLRFAHLVARPFFKNAFAVKPRIIKSKCAGCGACARACPRKAITIKKGKAVIDYSKCIRCYCCHELCPHYAVALRKSLLNRLFI